MAASALQPSSGPCNTVSRRRFVFQPPLDGGPLPFHGLGGVGFGVSLCCIAGFLRWTKIQLQFGKCRFYGHGERLATLCFFFQRIGNFAPQICFVGPVNLVSLFLPRRLEKGLGFPVAGRIEWTTGLARPLRCPHRISFFRQPQRLSRHNTPPFRRLDCFPLFSTAGKQREGGGKKGMEWKRSFAWSPLLATGWRNSCYEMTERS